MRAKIRQARAGDEQGLAELAGLLWPDASAEELREETDAKVNGRAPSTLPVVTLVAEREDGGLAGFVEAGLRSHADGCDTAHPVGFIEGWFVREELRGRGVGRALIEAAEAWARSHGCTEMASDALIGNHTSFRAHGALGFEVVDRCVHFRKSI